MPEALLKVQDLEIRERASRRVILDRISFDLFPGETIGIVGESGAGKTILARALLGLLEPSRWWVGGSIVWRNTELVGMPERKLREIRGREIALVPQEPELALHPLIRVKQQVDEVLRAHASCPRRKRQQQVRSVLAAVELADPPLGSAYPHQLSGGQRQRVSLAQALVSQPSLLIADEPTSALDNVTQLAILRLFRSVKRPTALALLFITHDLALLSGLADRILVMQAGRIVEAGDFERIYVHPQHEYTRALRTAIIPGLWELHHLGA